MRVKVEGLMEFNILELECDILGVCDKRDCDTILGLWGKAGGRVEPPCVGPWPSEVQGEG